MRKSRLLKFLLLLLLSLLVATACRRDEEPDQPLPTAMPTTVLPTEATPPAAATAVPQPTAPISASTRPTSTGRPKSSTAAPLPAKNPCWTAPSPSALTNRWIQESVEAAFAISDDPHRFRQFHLAACRHLGLHAAQQPETAAAATVCASTKAQQVKTANPYKAALIFQVQTVGFLEVSQVIPGDGVAEVQTDGAITVLFNRPVVPLVSTGQQAELPQPLTLRSGRPWQRRMGLHQHLSLCARTSLRGSHDLPRPDNRRFGRYHRRPAG